MDWAVPRYGTFQTLVLPLYLKIKNVIIIRNLINTSRET